MEIVYASLKRRQPAAAAGATGEAEAAEAVDALWAHAEPADGLQHASAQPAGDRIDLLLYLLSRDPFDPLGRLDPAAAVFRAHGLIARSHRTSPTLRRRYLPPEPPQATDHTAR
ncbi:hypothetical protein ACFRAR_11625 [Kitasatospora sp. NPDC056651]|uniref:hypothetical protein n=1 Tax=Kitasatospora sp. NPDC056651 TaxID=3345892 RepID=UPI00367B8E00